VLSFYTVLGVEITQPYSAYPDIPANGIATNVAPFQISTLPSYICNDDINLQLTFYTSSHESFVVPLTIPPSGVCSPGDGPCGFCLPPINGSITSDDAVAPSRLNRNLALARCAAPKAFPGFVSGNVRFDAYKFTNTSPVDFDPSNIASNYLADAAFSTGNGVGTNFPFSCTVPAGAKFTVVVNEIDANAGCTNYTLALSGLPCASPSLTIGTLPRPNTRLSWPDSAGGYVLETSPSVDGAAWRVVTNEPLVESGSYTVTNEVESATKFYRLRKP
jgi:hypothetical protein